MPLRILFTCHDNPDWITNSIIRYIKNYLNTWLLFTPKEYTTQYYKDRRRSSDQPTVKPDSGGSATRPAGVTQQAATDHPRPYTHEDPKCCIEFLIICPSSDHRCFMFPQHCINSAKIVCVVVSSFRCKPTTPQIMGLDEWTKRREAEASTKGVFKSIHICTEPGLFFEKTIRVTDASELERFMMEVFGIPQYIILFMLL